MNCRYHTSADELRDPCICQPPTMWGITFMWHCECCEEPRSSLKYMLCPDCEAHQYAHRVTVDSDHQEMRDQESYAPSPAPSGAGRGFLMPA